jgi:SAM-dependent methyltransferase
MERAHAVLGVGRRAVAFVERSAARNPSLSVLDVATGSGWLPRLLRRRTAAPGTTLRVVGLDTNAQVIAAAARASDRPSLCRGDARRLPFAPRSVDLVVCTMTLHHFSRPDAVLLLKEIDAAARLNWMVCDLVRSRPLTWLATAATRALSRNELTRHDGPASARRAYSLAELRELAREAGLPTARIRRFSLVCGEITKGREW